MHTKIFLDSTRVVLRVLDHKHEVKQQICAPWMTILRISSLYDPTQSYEYKNAETEHLMQSKA